VLIACCLEGLSRDEAARQLGWSAGRVKGLLERGRELLRRRLARRGFELGAALLVAAATRSAAAVPPVPVEACVRFAQGQAATGVPPVAVALSEGVVRATLIQKAKAVAVMLLAIALAVGGLFAHRAAEGTSPSLPPAPPDRVLLLDPVPQGPVRMAWVEKRSFAHKAAVSAVAFDRGRVAAGDRAGRLFLWDEKAGGKELLIDVSTLVGAKGKAVPISFVQFSPDGEAVYFALADGTTIQRCSLGKGGKNRVFPGNIQPEGSRARTTPGVISGDRVLPGDVRLGAVSSHGLTPDGRYWLQSAALFDPDRCALLIVPNLLPKFDEQLVGEPEATFRHAGLVAHAAPVSGEAAVSVSTAGTLRRWEKGKDEPAWEVKLRDVADFDATGVVVSPGGALVAVTGDAGQVWTFDAKSGKLLARAEKLTEPVHAAGFSPDGARIVAGCEDKTARVYDARTGRQLAVLEGHAASVTAVAFGADGTIVTGSADKSVKVWELRK
jgi:WD40 repeat protein